MCERINLIPTTAITLITLRETLSLGGHGGSQPTPRVKRHMKKNSRTDRLVDLAGRLTSITMHHLRDLIKPGPTELLIKSISERGPAKYP